MAEPVALKEEWLNVYPIEDATTARVVAGPEAGALPRWKTFGRAAAVGKDDPRPRRCSAGRSDRHCWSWARGSGRSP